MIRLLFYLISILIISKIKCIVVTKHSLDESYCSIDKGKIWYVDVSRRFIRTFYNFSQSQLENQESDYKMRVCDLEMRFLLDQVEHTEWFQLKRLKHRKDSKEYFLIEHMQVRNA